MANKFVFGERPELQLLPLPAPASAPHPGVGPLREAGVDILAGRGMETCMETSVPFLVGRAPGASLHHELQHLAAVPAGLHA